MPGRLALPAALLAACLLVPADAFAAAGGKGAAIDPRAWKKTETDCLSRCKKPTLTWKAGEKLDTWKKRIAQEGAFADCQLECTKDYVHQPAPKKTTATGTKRKKRAK